MESPEKLSLYELISFIQEIKIPDIFESKLDEYILGLADGDETARIIANMLKNCDSDGIQQFMEAIEDHMLDLMTDALVAVDSAAVENKLTYLWRLVIKYIYN